MPPIFARRGDWLCSDSEIACVDRARTPSLKRSSGRAAPRQQASEREDWGDSRSIPSGTFNTVALACRYWGQGKEREAENRGAELAYVTRFSAFRDAAGRVRGRGQSVGEFLHKRSGVAKLMVRAAKFPRKRQNGCESRWNASLVRVPGHPSRRLAPATLCCACRRVFGRLPMRVARRLMAGALWRMSPSFIDAPCCGADARPRRCASPIPIDR